MTRTTTTSTTTVPTTAIDTVAPEESEAKKPSSQARINANRINAQSSTGPRTPEGKARSRYGNLKDGTRCETLVVLPGEDEDVLRRRLENWPAHFGALTDAELYAAENVVHFSWSLDRARAAERAALGINARRLIEGHDDRKAAEVEQAIELLDATPGEAIRRLRGSAQGVRYLLGQWQVLADRLAGYYTFEETQLRRAIHLGGRRPIDATTDPVLWPTLAAQLAGYGPLADGTGMTVERADNILGGLHPEAMRGGEFGRWLGRLIAAMPASRQEGRLFLQDVVARALAELEDLLPRVVLKEEIALEDDVEAAGVDRSTEGMRCVGYVERYDRMMRGAKNALERLKAARRADEAAGEAPERPVTPDPGPTPPPVLLPHPDTGGAEAGETGGAPAVVSVVSSALEPGNTDVVTGALPADAALGGAESLVDIVAEPIVLATGSANCAGLAAAGVAVTAGEPAQLKCPTEATCHNGSQAVSEVSDYERPREDVAMTELGPQDGPHGEARTEFRVGRDGAGVAAGTEFSGDGSHGDGGGEAAQGAETMPPKLDPRVAFMVRTVGSLLEQGKPVPDGFEAYAELARREGLAGRGDPSGRGGGPARDAARAPGAADQRPPP